jgi:uncharacterized membrane protein
MSARRHSWDLIAVMGLALLALAVALLSGGPNPALTAVSVPLALFLPGYALVANLLPQGQLGFPERVALALGTSIAVTVAAGLLLNALDIPLAGGPWRVLLAGFTAALVALALLRRRQGRLAPVGALAAQMTSQEALLLGTGALIIGLALGLGGIGIASPPSEPFTGFWALGQEQGARALINVGLTNEEGRPMTYRVAVQAGDRLLAEWPQVSVPANGAWQAEATVPPALRGQDIIATAYRTGDPAETPYRWARVTMEGSAPP